MPIITFDTKYSEREDFCYSFMLMSEVYQDKNMFSHEQLPKLIADIKKELQDRLKEYTDLLPLFASASHELSLLTNLRRTFLEEYEDQTITAECLIDRLFIEDSSEMTARVIMSADNNIHELEFYRGLIKDSLNCVKYCLEMNVTEGLRTALLSMLVDRDGCTKRIRSFAVDTLNALRNIYIKYNYGIKKARDFFCDEEAVTKNMLNAGYIKENDTVIVVPVLLNPNIIYVCNYGGIKYIRLGSEYEQIAAQSVSSPTISLEIIGKIFSDPVRCQIIRKLEQGGSYLSQLARNLNIPTNSLHYHIQVLNDANVIKGGYQGKRFVYELNPIFFKTVSNTVLKLTK